MSYINRKDVEDAIRKYADIKHSNGEPIEYVNGILKSISVISEQPSADVVEVKHGYWKMEYHETRSTRGRLIRNKTFTCSNCNRRNGRIATKYCSNCGAKMDSQ